MLQQWNATAFSPWLDAVQEYPSCATTTLLGPCLFKSQLRLCSFCAVTDFTGLDPTNEIAADDHAVWQKAGADRKATRA